MIQIRIVNPAVKELKGVSKTSGKDYHIRTQTAHAFVVDRDGVVSEYPEKFEIMLEKEQTPFSAGFYQLHPSALYISRDGRLSVSPRLMAVAPETPRKG